MEGIGIPVGYMAFRRALSINLGWFSNRIRISARKGLNSTSGAQFVALPLVKPVVWFAGAVVNWRSRSVAKSAFYYESHFGFCLYAFAYRSFWYKVISIHQAIQLVQIQIDSVEVTVQPTFRDICFFLFTRDNCTSGLITIFLRFHCLGLYGNDSFPLQLIDQITFLLSRQMCHVN